MRVFLDMFYENRLSRLKLEGVKMGENNIMFANILECGLKLVER